MDARPVTLRGGRKVATQEARGRLAQDNRFEMTEFIGRQLEGAIAFRCGSTEPRVDVVGFTLAGNTHWHRCFLDAGIGFWEEWHANDVFTDFVGCARIDVAECWAIRGATFTAAECFPSEGGTARFEWRFSSGTLVLRYETESDMDSATILTFKAGEAG